MKRYWKIMFDLFRYVNGDWNFLYTIKFSYKRACKN